MSYGGKPSAVELRPTEPLPSAEDGRNGGEPSLACCRITSNISLCTMQMLRMDEMRGLVASTKLRVCFFFLSVQVPSDGSMAN